MDDCLISTDFMCSQPFAGLQPLHKGKVRDTYDLGDNQLLVVATDRISAFDVVMKTGIPGKGRVLTQMTVFWLQFLGDICPHHLLTTELPPWIMKWQHELSRRVMVVRKLRMLPVEAIVRGYLAGSGWKEYHETGTVHGIQLPPGLRECDKLPKPLYTPSTKAVVGHDQNISPEEAACLIGDPVIAKQVEEYALALYQQAARYAETMGVIIADTKLEFGLDEIGRVVLGDEVLTPDSSRFWPRENYQPGHDQPSFDKQFLRNWLTSVGFDKKTPMELPAEVVDGTVNRYLEAYVTITGGSYM